MNLILNKENFKNLLINRYSDEIKILNESDIKYASNSDLLIFESELNFSFILYDLIESEIINKKESNELINNTDLMIRLNKNDYLISIKF